MSNNKQYERNTDFEERTKRRIPFFGRFVCQKEFIARVGKFKRR